MRKWAGAFAVLLVVAAAILDRRVTSLETKAGYRRSFVPGQAIDPAEIKKLGASPTSVECWAYLAVPEPGAGVRSFCVDCSWAIR